MYANAIDVAEQLLQSTMSVHKTRGGDYGDDATMDAVGARSNLEQADAAASTKNDACEGWSGADVAAWVREACVCAIKERTRRCDDAPDESPVLVSADNFMEAYSRISPSVSAADRRRYELLRTKLKGS